VKPRAFDYVAATSVTEAVAHLARHDGAAKVLAGGQSLVPMLNFRLLDPAVLVDINRIADLSGIAERDGALRIGALTRHRQLEIAPVIAERFPVLTAAMAHVAHLAIRNRGTIGGSLSHADPAAELPALMLLLDATIAISGRDGERRVPARDFFEGTLTTALDSAELVTAIDLPALPPRTGWGFEEIARRSGDFAMAGVAATVSLDGNTAADARIALFGVHETPLRAEAAEALLRGTSFDADRIAAAATTAQEAVVPMDDLHASADYRRHLVGVLVRRAVAAAWARARGGAA
jgi:carbon-monoxide dehydrogenase medium subunit